MSFVDPLPWRGAQSGVLRCDRPGPSSLPREHAWYNARMRGARPGCLAALVCVAACGRCAGDARFAGAEIVFELTGKIDPERAVELIEYRIGERGIAEPDVARRGDQIVVRVPGLDDEYRQRVTELLQRQGTLGVHVVAGDSELMRALAERVQGADRDEASELAIDAVIESWGLADPGATLTGRYLTAPDRIAVLEVDEARRVGCYHEHMRELAGTVECRIAGRTVLEDYLARVAAAVPALTTDADHRILYEELHGDGDAPNVWRAHHVARATVLEGRDVVWAELSVAPATGGPLAVATLTPRGAAKLAAVTRDLPGQRLAVVLDDTVAWTFAIDAPAAAARIVFSPASRDPDRALREADDMLDVLRAGIPMGLRLVSSRTLGNPD